MRRHEYIARGPRERYARTVTAVQEHDWQDQLEINKQVLTSLLMYLGTCRSVNMTLSAMHCCASSRYRALQAVYENNQTSCYTQANVHRLRNSVDEIYSCSHPSGTHLIIRLRFDAVLSSMYQVVHGKKSCAETVYASELVKSGVYF